MIPETCPDHIPLKSLCCYFCPTKAQIRTYLTVLLLFNTIFHVEQDASPLNAVSLEYSTSFASKG